MQDIRRQTEECAQKLLPRANSAGTTAPFLGCIPFAVDLALALNCSRVRNTSAPGFGILFEAEGRPNAGQFSLFATRPNLDRGVVALAVSDNALGTRGPHLRARVNDICRGPHAIALPKNGRYKWPAVGFTTAAAGEQIFHAITAFLVNEPPPERPVAESTADPNVLQSIKERRGQPEFRQRLLAAYEGQCAITGCGVVEALEAAHIVPYSAGGTYEVSNGLLMRADIHTLFDLHLLSICPVKNVVLLNPRLRPAYGDFEGMALHVPRSQADKPNLTGLVRHHAIWQSLF